jgi:hypothetical protein
VEPVAQPVFQGDQLLGRAVTGDHDLLVGVVQRVERVEELLLGLLLFSRNWMSSTRQDVDVAVTPAEAFGAARRGWS